ncbi:uncharacterized protein LOC100151367 precursor [Danio rerio]|uniref:Novel protein n=1 Tax=Danio rerio TaxID=7955 RepID=B0S594_DANRE|nr:uncharacterized protein LOC100151367 precursor [Danio rerio]CAQ13810.1 novel protein [Danio rerio]|eukprot:NP_001138293.1 uncharacterized protein LOC100151367 precursor [Danio rerio]
MKTMNFQILVLAFAVMIVTNIQCEARPQEGKSDKSAEVKGHAMPRKCNCQVRGTALDRNCVCEMPHKSRPTLNPEQKNMCLKKKIKTFRKCLQFMGANKKIAKGASLPI